MNDTQIVITALFNKFFEDFFICSCLLASVKLYCIASGTVSLALGNNLYYTASVKTDLHNLKLYFETLDFNVTMHVQSLFPTRTTDNSHNTVLSEVELAKCIPL